MATAPTTILLRSEQTDGEISVIENTLPAGSPGPPEVTVVGPRIGERPSLAD